MAKLIITLSAAAIAYLTSIAPSGKCAGQLHFSAIVVGFFGEAIALLIVFVLLQTYWYEEYCHAPEHDSYKPWKYALNVSIGWTGLLSFIFGFVWLAHNLFGP